MKNGLFYLSFPYHEKKNSGTQIFLFHSPHVKESKRVLHSGIQIPAMDSGFFVRGTWIPNSNFLSCTLDSKAQDSTFHWQKFRGFRNFDSFPWDKFHDFFLSLLSNLKTNIQPPPEDVIGNQM